MDYSKTPQPINGIEVSDQGAEWLISASTRSPVALFYVPFMLLWSILAIVSLSKAIFIGAHLSVLGIISASVFFLAGLLFWWIAVLFSAGHYRIAVNHTSHTLFIGVGKFGWTRTFIWTDIQKIEEIDNYINRRQFGFNERKIRISGTREYKFGILLNDEQRNFIIRFLRTKLSQSHTIRPDNTRLSTKQISSSLSGK